MIAGAIYALHAKDLLSALISCGIVGYSLVICFLLLKAPDLAIVQIVVETISLIIMVAVVLDSTRNELKLKRGRRIVLNNIMALIAVLVFLYFFIQVINTMGPFGEHEPRMALAYMQGAAEITGSANLVAGVLFDFRGLDTLGEATILLTAAIGVVIILRKQGRK